MRHPFAVQGLQRAAGQLAGAVAGQRIDQHQRPGQEDRIDALTQFAHQGVAGPPGRHHEGRQPGNGLVGRLVGQEEGAVLHPGDSFFLSLGAPYAYTAGPEGVEVLEFRKHTELDMHISESLGRWEQIVANAQAHSEAWAAEAATRT